MKPDTRTVNELFERDVRYVVPLYQRPYVWGRDDQWQPLWDDIVVLLDHQIGGSAGGPGHSHFLGAIVLEQETQAPGKIPMFTVIDGQQRLTTLQVLLCAARTVASNMGVTTEAGVLDDLVLNDAKKASGDERLKVWPTNVNRRAFRAVLIPEPEGPLADDPENLIQEAYEFFTQAISEWAAAEDGEQEHRLNTLRVTLSDLVKVVSITLEAGDNAQIIFETLNARGTPLLALDLVKNAVFHQAAREGEKVDQLYAEVWQPELEQDLWREERRQGRLLRAHGELFLMHWLGMKLRRVIPATELFTTFRQEILNGVPRPHIGALIRQMNRDARIYRSFDEQPIGSPEALFFERLEALDVTTLMPLVLWLFTEPSVTREARRVTLAYLESWLIRRMLLRLTTKNYNFEVAALLTKVGADPTRADSVLFEHLSGATAETNRWPGDEELIAALKTRDVYGVIAQARLVMVLKAVELSLYDEGIDLPTVPTSLWIEHVMPQQWDKHWRLPAGLPHAERLELAEQREAHLHRLGNLTLTSWKMNIELSNSAWTRKQSKLNSGGKLLMNARLIERHADCFDERAIDRRSVALARAICKIWPR